MADLDDVYDCNGCYSITDDEEPDLPTDKYGIWLPLAMMFGIIVFAVLFVAVLFYCNRSQEQAKMKARQAKKAVSREEAMKSNLTCKPWAPDDDDAETGATVALRDNGGSDDSDSDSAPSAADATDDHVECKDGSVCCLCKEEYQPGQPVYESNNPQCGHQFHQKCMDKWLQYQSSCPICNQPYSLQTV